MTMAGAPVSARGGGIRGGLRPRFPQGFQPRSLTPAEAKLAISARMRQADSSRGQARAAP